MSKCQKTDELHRREIPKSNEEVDERAKRDKIGLGRAFAKFQVDDKTRMMGIQYRGKAAFPIEDEFLITRARVDPNTMSR